MWSKRIIEEITQQKLIDELSKDPGEERFALYLTARKHLVEQVLPQIARILPDYTDHGASHVSNVLDNVAKLLGLEDINAETYPTDLSGVELYCLILSILFHDVGNIFGREEHQHRVAEIYDFVRSVLEKQERKIVLITTAAHCSDVSDGSQDTLKDLIGDFQLERRRIRVQEIASILRFADELAEGPQRTSLFMQKYHQYSPESEIFHQYSTITEVIIDRGNQRIALTYDIDINTNGSKRISNEDEAKLRELLAFIYKRICKLNQERKYAKHYCELLSPFKETAVAFNFSIDHRPYDLDFPRSVPLTDLVVPGDKEKEFPEYHGEFEVDKVIERIRNKLQSIHRPDRLKRGINRLFSHLKVGRK